MVESTAGAAGSQRSTGATRGRGLSVDLIVSTALAQARSVGFEHVGIREVARRLDVSAPALYRHVRDREHLLQLMTDAVVDTAFTGHDAEFRAVASVEDWVSVTRRVTVEARRVYSEYPGLADHLLSRPPRPGRHADDQTSALTRLGVSSRAARVVVRTGRQWVLGYLRAEARSADDTLFRTGLEWMLDGAATTLRRDLDGGASRRR